MDIKIVDELLVIFLICLSKFFGLITCSNTLFKTIISNFDFDFMASSKKISGSFVKNNFLTFLLNLSIAKLLKSTPTTFQSLHLLASFSI